MPLHTKTYLVHPYILMLTFMPNFEATSSRRSSDLALPRMGQKERQMDNQKNMILLAMAVTRVEALQVVGFGVSLAGWMINVCFMRLTT